MTGTVIALKSTGIPIYALIIFSCFLQRNCFCRKPLWQGKAGCDIPISSSVVSAASSKCTTSFKAQRILQSISYSSLSANEKVGQEPEVKDLGCMLLLGSAPVPQVLTTELLPGPAASPVFSFLFVGEQVVIWLMNSCSFSFRQKLHEQFQSASVFKKKVVQTITNRRK